MEKRISDLVQNIDVRANLSGLRQEIKENENRIWLQNRIEEDVAFWTSFLSSDDAKTRKNIALLLGDVKCQKAMNQIFEAYNKETSSDHLCMDIRSTPCNGHTAAVHGHRTLDKRQYRFDDSAGHIDRHHSGIGPAYDLRHSFRYRRSAIPCPARKLDLAGRPRQHSAPCRKQKELPLGQAPQLRRRPPRRLHRPSANVTDEHTSLRGAKRRGNLLVISTKLPHCTGRFPRALRPSE